MGLSILNAGVSREDEAGERGDGYGDGGPRPLHQLVRSLPVAAGVQLVTHPGCCGIEGRSPKVEKYRNKKKIPHIRWKRFDFRPLMGNYKIWKRWKNMGV